MYFLSFEQFSANSAISFAASLVSLIFPSDER